jgi:hypothetical protein
MMVMVRSVMERKRRTGTQEYSRGGAGKISWFQHSLHAWTSDRKTRSSTLGQPRYHTWRGDEGYGKAGSANIKRQPTGLPLVASKKFRARDGITRRAPPVNHRLSIEGHVTISRGYKRVSGKLVHGHLNTKRLFEAIAMENLEGTVKSQLRYTNWGTRNGGLAAGGMLRVVDRQV